MLSRINNEYGVVSKINVTNLEKSMTWYNDILGLINDSKFYEPHVWAQLNCPGIKNFALGLSAHDSPIGSRGQTITFMIADIKLARQILIERDIMVTPIEEAGKGVLLVRFSDPDGNELLLRQNSSSVGHKVGDHIAY